MEQFEPRTLAELAGVLRAERGGRRSIRVKGGGTKQDWLPPGKTDLVLVTSGLDEVVEHAHGDMTATVQAGLSLHRLQELLARRGQRLAVDPPLGAGREATVGGILACDDAGPSRFAFGSLRELCIGMTFVLADGTVARSGGRVIKNVAGYDLCKLFCGSRGALGVVAEVSLRLHPIPEAEGTLLVSDTPDDGAAAALEVWTPALEPVAVTHQRGALWVRFEGTERSVAARLDRASALLAQHGEVERIEGAESRRRWTEATEERRGRTDDTTAVLTAPPDRVGALLVFARSDEVDVRAVADPLLGQAILHLAPSDPAVHARYLTGLRSRARAEGGQLRVRVAAPGLAERFDVEGRLPSAAGVMRALKRELDPEDRLMPGLAYRFLPPEPRSEGER